MSDTTIEAILGAARRAAFAGGLTRLLRIHLRVGPDAGITGPEARRSLVERWQGPLFCDCEVTWESARSGTISLAAVEGVSVTMA